MKAIILAGGEGTRLRPLTLTIPKPLIPIDQKNLTEHIFEILKSAGVTEVILSIGHLAEKIKNYFDANPPQNLKIEYLVEPKPMGTAGPLILLKRRNYIFTEDFIVVNGDNLFSLDFSQMINFHQKNHSVATLGLTKVDDVSNYGVVEIKNGKIKQFVEKPSPDQAPSNLINSGYYIFSPEIFDFIDEQADFLMLEKNIFPAIAQAGELGGFIGQGQWFDTGTPDRYECVKAAWRLN